MRSSVHRGHHWIRLAWITLVILGLVHTPLPLPDFHNIRHHDGPGQVCEHHDHLLRWHPGAGFAEDVAILHWHWLLPGTERSDALPVRPGKAIHAHVPDGFAPDPNSTPAVTSDTTGRDLSRLASAPIGLTSVACCEIPVAFEPSPRRFIVSVGAPLARSAPVASILQRWDC